MKMPISRIHRVALTCVAGAIAVMAGLGACTQINVHPADGVAVTPADKTGAPSNAADRKTAGQQAADGKLQDATAQLAAVKGQLLIGGQQRDALTMVLKQLDDQVRSLRLDVDKSATAKTQLDVLVKQKQAQVAELGTQVRALSDTKGGLETEIKAARSKEAEIDSNTVALQAQATALRREVITATSTHKDLEAQLAATSIMLVAQKAAVAQADHEVSGLAEKKATLLHDLQLARAESLRLQSSAQSANNELAADQGQLSEIRDNEVAAEKSLQETLAGVDAASEKQSRILQNLSRLQDQVATNPKPPQIGRRDESAGTAPPIVPPSPIRANDRHPLRLVFVGIAALAALAATWLIRRRARHSAGVDMALKGTDRTCGIIQTLVPAETRTIDGSLRLTRARWSDIITATAANGFKLLDAAGKIVPSIRLSKGAKFTVEGGTSKISVTVNNCGATVAA